MSDARGLVEKQRTALKRGILELGEAAATALQRSLAALREHDLALAADIIADDADINQQRRALEHQALVVLAAHQPAGPDLRLVGASLEMTAEIERIADHAADVARILLEAPDTPFPEAFVAQILSMGEIAVGMLNQVMTEYSRERGEASTEHTLLDENAVDAAEQRIIAEVTQWLCEDCRDPGAGIKLLWIAHHYERAADRVTNIAEQLVYIATGETPELN